VSELTGMEIGYVVRDASRWEADTERDASEFDAGYYVNMLAEVCKSPFCNSICALATY